MRRLRGGVIRVKPGDKNPAMESGRIVMSG